MKLPRISVIAKIAFFILILVVLFGIFNYYRVTEKGKDLVYDIRTNSIEVFLAEKTARINAVFDESMLMTQMIASRSVVQNFLDKPDSKGQKEIQQIVEDYQKLYPKYLAIYLMDTRGNTLVSSDKKFINQNYSLRNYFKQAVLGKPYTEHSVGLTSKQAGYYYSRPIYQKNIIVGVVVVKQDPMIITNIVADLSQTYNSNVMLIDELGVVVYSNDITRIYKSIGPVSQKTAQNIIEDKKYPFSPTDTLGYDNLLNSISNGAVSGDIIIFDKRDNEEEYLATRKIGNHPFYLILETEIDQLTEYISQTTAMLGSSIFFSLAILCGLIILILWYYLKPLSSLKKHIDIMGRGEFDSQVVINTNDEWGDMADAFNFMSFKLKNYYKTLEETVKTRTKELTDTVAEKENSKTALLNVLEDMETEKKKVENYANELKKFELAVSHANDHIVITDENGIVLFANKSVERITGFPIKEVLGRKAGSKELWGGNESKSTYEYFWKIVKNDKKQFVGQFNNKKRDGSRYIAEARVSPVLDKDGNVIFFVGIETDVTKAKEVDRMKTEFVSLASHQLRTPLAGMRWVIEMLLGDDVGKPNKEQYELLQNLLQTNERMTDLVDNLLNVSRIESGKMSVNPLETDIQEAFSHVHDVLKFTIDRKNIKYSLNIDPGAQKAYIDPKLIKEIFSNLLSNAIKYTPENGNVSVSVKNEENLFVLKISDTGYGIPKEDQLKMFQKFYRAENVQIYVPEGTGLGLYVIKSIVEAMKGNITFESTENQGTTFTVKLPISTKNVQL